MPKKENNASAKNSFNSFSRGRLNLKQDLDILYQYDHPVSGAHLIMAQTKAVYGKGDNKSPRYILAWAGAEAEDIEIYRYFKDKRKAFNAFKDSSGKPPPTREDILEDWQQQRVYDWEEEQFGKYLSNIDLNTMQRAADRITKDFNIASVQVSYEKPHGNKGFHYNYYIPDDHAVTMESTHLETLIHELAHAIDYKANGNKWADHGPSFVRTLITLLDKYMFLDADEMEASAKEAGIHVADKKDLPNLPRL